MLLFTVFLRSAEMPMLMEHQCMTWEDVTYASRWFWQQQNAEPQMCTFICTYTEVIIQPMKTAECGIKYELIIMYAHTNKYTCITTEMKNNEYTQQQ